ncbi:DUF6221 family protein [Amycolatopsis sp. DSM 110486]|uniref:DUF6221 family protein n=1 Tax=Amycolatopsis sp. DSM 110486 TaxID=2865832 RepID=UPI001C6A175F|nr:DUF6221 family protein [Amycolatopsis sp. DSM 110486]QYN26699.1 hypothetical protein K1T34_52960 [Amycolatopsis sp. DSM 110486]
MDDLIVFLRARLDEDTAHASRLFVLKRNLSERWSELVIENEALRELAAFGSLLFAEVAAKRRIIELHPIGGSLRAPVTDNKVYVCDTCGPNEWPMVKDATGKWDYVPEPPNGGDFYPCETLRLLALPYSGHPDYREEWRP